MRITILLFILLPLTALPQGLTYPRQKADSIVAFFLGNEIFQRYVTLDVKESQYRLLDHKSVSKVSFNREATFTPNSFLFHYNFRHPKFSGETFPIRFALDSTGKFIPNEE